MKKIFIASIVVLFYACNSEEKTTPVTETKEVASAPAAISNMSGYTPTYSASFEMGDPKNAEAVLAIYKDWDNGNLEPSKMIFADSVSLFLNDGSMIAGLRDSAIAIMQDFRNMFSAIKSTVHGVFPVKSTDKNENWVCIWATEVNTTKKGKTDSVHLQETWRFNKDGKVDLIYQYGAKALPPKATK
jgi:Mg2+/Co2+ transporter CorC